MLKDIKKQKIKIDYSFINRFIITGIFIFLIITGLFVLNLYMQSKEISNEIRLNVDLAKVLVDDYKKSTMQDLNIFEKYLLDNNFTKQTIDTELKNDKFEAIFVFHNDKMIAGDQNKIQIPPNFNLNVFKDRFEKTKFYFSDFIYYDKEFRSFVLHKIDDKNYILAFLDLKDLQYLLSSMNSEREENNIFLLDENGYFVASSNAYYTKEHMNFYDSYSFRFNLFSLMVGKNLQGYFEFLYIKKLDNFKDSVGVSRYIFALNDIYFISFALMFVSFLSVLLLMILDIKILIDKMLMPIENLKRIFLFPSMAKDISQEIKSSSKDLGEISEHVISMMDKISQDYYKISNMNKKFENIFIQSPLNILIVRPEDGLILNASQSAIEFYGYKDELLKKSIFDLDISSSYEQGYEKYKSSYLKQNYFISTHITNSGEKKVQVEKRYILSNKSSFLFYIIFDVTKQQELFKNMSRQKEYLEFGPNVMIIYDLDKDEILDITKNIEQKWGYEYRQIINKNITLQDLIHHDDYYSVLNSVKNSFELFKENMQKDEFCLEFRIKHSDMQYYNYRAFIKILEFENMPCVVFYCLNIDDMISNEISYKKDINRYKNILKATSSIIFELDLEENSIFFNENFSKNFGYTQKYQISRMNYDRFKQEIVYQGDAQILQNALEDYINLKTDELLCEFRIFSKNAEIYWLRMQARSIEKDKHGKIKILSGVVENITQRKNDELKLNLIAGVFSYSHEGIIITDEMGKIIDVNNAFEIITGYSKDEVIGKFTNFLYFGDDEEEFYTRLKTALRQNKFYKDEVYSKRKDGSKYPELITVNAIKNDRDEIVNYMAMFVEISEIKQKEDSLRKIANFDDLTQIPNRKFFTQLASEQMQKAKQKDKFIAVLFIDFDGFKKINDTCGHDAGDLFLKEMANSMKSALRHDDILARLGGDEFGAIITNLERKDDAIKTIERILKACQKDIFFQGSKLHASSSIGVCFYRDENYTFQELLSMADKAMYIAKTSGKNQFYIYDSDESSSDFNIKTEKERIKNSIQKGEFFMLYQPIVSLNSNEIIGFELLLRWIHPNMGMLLPGEFLFNIKEKIIEEILGCFSVSEAFKMMKKLKEEFDKEFFMNINASVEQLANEEFLDNFIEILKENQNVNLNNLVIEVDLNPDNIENFKKIAPKYVDLGIKFGLNKANLDSLELVKNLDFSFIKVNKDSCAKVCNDWENLEVAKSMLDVSNSMDMLAVAVAPEDIKSAKILRAMGYKYIQANFISEALMRYDVFKFIKEFENPVSKTTKEEFMNLSLVLMHKDFVKKFRNTVLLGEYTKFDSATYEDEFQNIKKELEGKDCFEKHKEVHDEIFRILTLCKTNDFTMEDSFRCERIFKKLQIEYENIMKNL